MAVKTFFKRVALTILSLPVFSFLTAVIVRIPIPHFLTQSIIKRVFIAGYGCNPKEAEKPVEAYRSILAFFTRRLKKGVRPLAKGTNQVVSPVDGRIMSMGKITNGQLLQVKGRPYSLSQLLRIPTANTIHFNGGWYITCYLSPADYHRIHHPWSGEIKRIKRAGQLLFPVNDFSLQHFKDVFCRNKRKIIFYQVREKTAAMVLVGALNVGTIPLSPEIRKGASIKMGDEAGRFELGSTVVLVFPPDLFIPENIKAGKRLILGRPLGRLVNVKRKKPRVRNPGKK